MKDFLLENNNNYSSIVHGDNIKDNSKNNKFTINKSSARGSDKETFDSRSVCRQLTKNNKIKCKTILNEHDIKHAMLHANQINLKNSIIHGTAKNQLVNLNFFSTDGKLDQRKNLEKLSLQYVLSKGE